MPRPKDVFTSTEADAGAYERWRGMCDDHYDQPHPDEYREES